MPLDSSSCDKYQLIDFGAGRKLELLSGYLVDRPSPAAIGLPRQSPKLWRDASARYDEKRRKWIFREPWPSSLLLDCENFSMPVRPTPFGHIGLFPEQAANWRWIHQQARVMEASSSNSERVRETESHAEALSERALGLNLFGYTGASSMAMLSGGLAVCHVDAAKPNVQSCRSAAELNGWQSAPIRYLVDDALKFARREVRRQRQYAMIVLDPPAYGHSPAGKAWRLERDLWPLLDACFHLLSSSFSMLVTGHSPQVDAEDVVNYIYRSNILDLAGTPDHDPNPPRTTSGLQVESGRSCLRTRSGRSLDAGFFVRISSGA